MHEGMLIWDISDPVNPKQVSEWKTGAHRHAPQLLSRRQIRVFSAGMPGYNGNILVILDVSDPAHPKEAGRWWMPGQKEGEPQGAGPQGFHGPANISPDGKMVVDGLRAA